MSWEPDLVSYIRSTMHDSQWLKMRLEMGGGRPHGVVNSDWIKGVSDVKEQMRRLRAALNDAVREESIAALDAALEIGHEIRDGWAAVVAEAEEAATWGAARLPPEVFMRETTHRVDELVRDLEGFPKWAAKQKD